MVQRYTQVTSRYQTLHLGCVSNRERKVAKADTASSTRTETKHTLTHGRCSDSVSKYIFSFSAFSSQSVNRAVRKVLCHPSLRRESADTGPLWFRPRSPERAGRGAQGGGVASSSADPVSKAQGPCQEVAWGVGRCPGWACAPSAVGQFCGKGSGGPAQRSSRSRFCARGVGRRPHTRGAPQSPVWGFRSNSNGTFPASTLSSLGRLSMFLS